MSSFITRVSYNDYQIEFHTDRMEYFDAVQKVCRKAIDRENPLMLFTPEEVCMAMIEHGHRDERFKIGDTIRYTPSEVLDILTKRANNRPKGYDDDTSFQSGAETGDAADTGMDGR